MSGSKSSRLRVALIASSLALALSGCGGGAVSVRSNLSGGAASASTPSAPVKAGPGLNAHYSGSGNLGLAILGVVIVADLVNWTAMQLRYAFGGDPASDPQRADAQSQIRMPAKCVYPVPEMC